MDIEINIKNFKAINQTSLKLKSGVNILIGPNGSGKTCLLQALMFLSDIFLEGVGQAVAQNGGYKRVYHRGEDKISFRVMYNYGERIFRRRKCQYNLVWDIDIQQKGKDKIATIVRENLKLMAVKSEEEYSVFEVEVSRESKQQYYEIIFPSPQDCGKDLFSAWDNNYSKSDLIDKYRSKLKTEFEEIKKNDNETFLKTFIHKDDRFRDLYKLFINLNEYNILPNVAREENEPLPFVEMLPNGKGLSNVIYALEKKNYQSITNSRSQYYFNFFRNYFYSRGFLGFHRNHIKLDSALSSINTELSNAVHPINRVSVDINQTNGKRLVVFKTDSDKFYPEEVSDGTIKWLSLLVSIYVPFSDIYLLEEPENFLHPWMQQRLISIMREEASKNLTIFLITTHSPIILNQTELDEVIVVKSNGNGTTATNISSKDKIRSVLEESDFGLGDLWVSGAIGGVPGDE